MIDLKQNTQSYEDPMRSDVTSTDTNNKNNACCGHHQLFDGASIQYKRALWLVIAINGFMFLFEFSSSFYAESQALKADALDFLMDASTYSISLLVIGKSLKIRSYSAFFKGYSLLIIAIIIFTSTIYKFFISQNPQPETIGIIALLALFANCLSLLILVKFRDGDANVRSVWLCSRNDAIGNLLVILSAGIILIIDHAWPDLVVALLLAGLFSRSALQIIRQAKQEIQQIPNK